MTKIGPRNTYPQSPRQWEGSKEINGRERAEGRAFVAPRKNNGGAPHSQMSRVVTWQERPRERDLLARRLQNAPANFRAAQTGDRDTDPSAQGKRSLAMNGGESHPHPTAHPFFLPISFYSEFFSPILTSPFCPLSPLPTCVRGNVWERNCFR